MATLAVSGRADLSEAQWAVLGPLLPATRLGRPPEHAKRTLIDGIRWRVRAGAPWRDVPPAYGPWQTVYGLFRRWQRNGTWRKIVAGLQARADAEGLITWDVSVMPRWPGCTSTPPGHGNGVTCRRSRRAGRWRSRRITRWGTPAAG